jgi:hypothetical protein
LLFLLLMLGNCAMHCDVTCDGEVVAPVRPEVRDAQGNNVPVASVTLVQGSRERPCHGDGTGSFVCRADRKGEATLTVEAEGQTLTHRFTPRITRQDTCYVAPEAIELLLEGEGCPPPSGTAIEGRLLDVNGAPVDGDVRVMLDSESAPCEPQQGGFSCESLSAYGATYWLTARVGSTLVERHVTVPAADCTVELTDATIDLRTQSCPEPTSRPAIRGVLHTSRGARVSVRASADGADSDDCVQERVVSRKDGQDVHYACPALTATGGGHYTLEASDGSRTLEESVTVIDIGCSPVTATRDFDLTLPAGSR